MRLTLPILLMLAMSAAQTFIDYGTKMQQTIGSTKIAQMDKDYPAALSKLDTLGEQLILWRAQLDKAVEDAANPVDEEPIGPPEATIEYSMNRSHIPAKCTRVSEEGSTLKVHYVGTLIKTKKAFASSFHTGSLPFSFRLGSDDVIDAWNKGLVGMCEGERRRLMVPWDMGYGAKGMKGVPPYSELQFDFELIELSSVKVKAPKTKKRKKQEL